MATNVFRSSFRTVQSKVATYHYSRRFSARMLVQRFFLNTPTTNFGLPFWMTFFFGFHGEDCPLPRVEVEAPLQLTGPELLALRFLASTVPCPLEGWFTRCDCMTYWPLLGQWQWNKPTTYFNNLKDSTLLAFLALWFSFLVWSSEFVYLVDGHLWNAQTLQLQPLLQVVSVPFLVTNWKKARPPKNSDTTWIQL